ncbi:MAG TPA: amino acid adenylation domain-containing protein, partial [Candidatus Deferrimicrobium sp.]|nr:amino acid adenylation domain-containing protein [Candidatus Deferrimicrobium sp.]
ERIGEPVWDPAPFDLSKAPLLRAMCLKTRQDRYYLMVDMHHIISDGISHAVLVRDFMALYQGKLLPSLKIQYKDFSEWQNSEKERKNLARQESYWLKTLAGEMPVLELATDFSRPTVQGFEGSALSFGVGIEETRALKELALGEGATLFMVLLSLYNVFLARLSGQEDIIIGTPTSGRRHADLEPVIGVFINTLALRNYPGGEKSFREFLREVKEGTIEAFENQDYPFEDLVEKAATTRDASRNPLFDVMLVLQNMDIDLEPAETSKHRPAMVAFDKPGEEIEQKQFLLARETSKFDLVLNGSESNESNGDLNFSLAYSTRLFKKETVERFLIYLKSILTAVLDDPEMRISEIEILSPEEKRKILFDFNDKEVEYPFDKTIDQLFTEQVEQIPDHIAVVGSTVETLRQAPLQISFRQLNEQANRLAYSLIEKGVLADNIVAIMLERSVEMIIGIMAILKSGGAYLPIDPNYPQERIQYMLQDSKAEIIVNSEFLIDVPQAPFLHHSSFIIHHSNLAYIIYTSGTTGRPKGVMVRHRNLANLVSGLKRTIYKNYSKGRHICFVSPYIFDASVKQIFASLLLGHSLYIVPENVRLDGVLLLAYYARHTIDISDGTPTHLRLFLESQAESKDEAPITVKHFIIGGEALPVNIMENFFARFGEKTKVTNIYGPTECTVDSTLYEVTPGNIKGVLHIPIGLAMPNCYLYIVSRWNRLQPAGIPGELLIGGHGVGMGYLNNPELTAEKFRPPITQITPIKEIKKINKSFAGVQGELFQKPPLVLYKTGDLARLLADGNIEFLGRLDHQVKIRGFRIELGEIENRLSRHPAVKEAVILARQKGEDKYLCAYVVLNSVKAPNLIFVEIKERLSRDLPDYMIPSYFVPIDKIPLTPNGKIDHHALPLPEIETDEEYVAPRDSIEKKLAHLWAEVLGIKEEKIGIENNFFQLGGQSLKAVVFIAKIHKQLNIKLPLAEVFKTPTIKGLAQYIKKAGEETFLSIAPVEKKEYYPLTPAQKRLYILQQMTPQDTVYNITKTVEMSEAPDLVQLEETFNKLLHRHESLRTSFHMVENNPVQRVHDTVALAIEYYDLTRPGEMPHEVSSKDFVRPFDLTAAPLLRAGLVKRRNASWVLIVDLHHIISDGVSQGVLTRDFMSLYRGEELPALKLQYKDYAEWQEGDKEQEALKGRENYWLKEFAGTIPVLTMPTDFARPMLQSFAGAILDFEVGMEETAALNRVMIKEGVTMYMVWLAMYNVFLAKISGQEDIITGTPAAGRRHIDMQQIIGMFVNTLAIRNFPRGEYTFKEFLKEVKEKTLQA